LLRGFVARSGFEPETSGLWNDQMCYIHLIFS